MSSDMILGPNWIQPTRNWPKHSLFKAKGGMEIGGRKLWDETSTAEP